MLELASPEDFAIPQCVDTAAQAIDIIRRRHDQWLREPGAGA
ncbi:MAG: hypothetical protein AB1724_08770 [Thermodesulfobacteriota bacterium]